VPLGAIVETADGLIGVDCTLRQLLARLRPQLAIALVQRIERGAA